MTADKRDEEKLTEMLEDCKKYKYASNTVAYFIIKAGWIPRERAVEQVRCCSDCDKGQVKKWDSANTWFEDCKSCSGLGIIFKDPK